MPVTVAEPSDVDAASHCLADAFAADPLIHHFFGDSPQGLRRSALKFFGLLLRLRITLGMPAFVLRRSGVLRGAAMGYDSTDPVWPEPFEREWADLEAATPGLGARFEVYGAIARRHQPPAPHHYLGVLGVHPSVQGQGGGRELLQAICQRSADDPLSSGVYLETANPVSLEFYRHQGFELRGEGDLGGTPLWCVFRPNPAARRARAPVLVSACLLGEAVRYDGRDKRCDDPLLQRWLAEGRVVPVCPEVAGGLPIPRPAAEIAAGAGGAAVLDSQALVVTADGADVSAPFLRGAARSLDLVRTRRIGVAVLKDGSPSCGSGFSHDGSFSGHRVEQPGVTTALLRRAGVQVFAEHELAEADRVLRALDGV